MIGKRLNLVLVGHVDHGKSTLIGRLLFDSGSLPLDVTDEIKRYQSESNIPVDFAHIMDHLEEERVEEKTIDTAQAFLETSKRGYAIIDAPGHKEYVKNMITGVSQADAALLVVSAVEGVEEQTKRHAYFLRMLELRNIIVAINKMDSVDYSEKIFNEVRYASTGFLEKLELKVSCVIPVSAVFGDNISDRSANMNWYEGVTILEALDLLEIEDNTALMPTRFPVQDVYSIDGRKVLVGRLAAGKLREGEEVLVFPDRTRRKVEAIKVFQKTKDSAEAGESIGIVLSGEPAIKRGDVLCSLTNHVNVSKFIDANILWLSSKPYRQGGRLSIRCATQKGECRIERINARIDSSTLRIIEEDGEVLERNEIGGVSISVGVPMVFEEFNHNNELGRFVLERDGQICAGGTTTRIS